MAALYISSPPKQLDIIDDTALSRALKTPGDLSTSRRRETPGDLSTRSKLKTPGDLSTALRKLDTRRRRANITIPALCAAAGIHTDTYDDARAGRSRPRPSTVDKLNAALNRLAAGEEAEEPRTLCLALLRLVTAHVARAAGAEPSVMLAQDFSSERPQDPVWLQAARLRRCAIYLLVEGHLRIGKAKIGHAIGHSRQAVHKAVAAIEAERERDPEFDALMQAMMTTLQGEA